MRYSVYTDGAASREKNLVGCGFLIITEDTYIDSRITTISGYDNPTEAETIAVGIAANYILENIELSKTDSIQFLSDCVAAIKYYRQHAISDATIRVRNPYVYSSIVVIRELSKKAKVSFNKVAGHKATCNPNKHVDALAKLAIRR